MWIIKDFALFEACRDHLTTLGVSGSFVHATSCAIALLMYIRVKGAMMNNDALYQPTLQGFTMQAQAPFAQQPCICAGDVDATSAQVHQYRWQTVQALDDVTALVGSANALAWTGTAAQLFRDRIHTLVGNASHCTVHAQRLSSGLEG